MNCRCQLNLAEMKMYEQETSDIADKAVRLVVEEVRVGSEATDNERRFGSWVKGFNALTDLLRLTLERQMIREVECSREGEAGEKIVKGIRTLSSALSKYDRYDSRANTVKGLLIGVTTMCDEFREIEVETFKPNLKKVGRTMHEWRKRPPVVTGPSTSDEVQGYRVEMDDTQGPVDCPGVSVSVGRQVEVDASHGQLVTHENNARSEGQAGIDHADPRTVDTASFEVRSEHQAEVAHANRDYSETEPVEVRYEIQAQNDNANQGQVAVHTVELQSEIEVEVGSSAQGQVGAPEPIDRPEDRFGNPGQGPVSTQEFDAHCGIQSEVLNEDQEVIIQEIDMESEEQSGVDQPSLEPRIERVYIEHVDGAEWWRCQLELDDMLAYEEECWKAEVRQEIELDLILYEMERIEEARLDADSEYSLEEENREELMAEAKNDVWLEDFVDEGRMEELKAEAEYDMKMEAYWEEENSGEIWRKDFELEDILRKEASDEVAREMWRAIIELERVLDEEESRQWLVQHREEEEGKEQEEYKGNANEIRYLHPTVGDGYDHEPREPGAGVVN